MRLHILIKRLFLARGGPNPQKGVQICTGGFKSAGGSGPGIQIHGEGGGGGGANPL